MKPPLATFDAASAWAAIPEEEKVRIGMAALILGCAAHGMGDGNGYDATPLTTASEVASSEIHDILLEAYQAHSPLFKMVPDLNQVGIRACTSCGCTDDHACFGGCSWVGPTTCSSCVPAADALVAARDA